MIAAPRRVLDSRIRDARHQLRLAQPSGAVQHPSGAVAHLQQTPSQAERGLLLEIVSQFARGARYLANNELAARLRCAAADRGLRL